MKTTIIGCKPILILISKMEDAHTSSLERCTNDCQVIAKSMTELSEMIEPTYRRTDLFKNLLIRASRSPKVMQSHMHVVDYLRTKLNAWKLSPNVFECDLAEEFEYVVTMNPCDWWTKIPAYTQPTVSEPVARVEPVDHFKDSIHKCQRRECQTISKFLNKIQHASLPRQDSLEYELDLTSAFEAIARNPKAMEAHGLLGWVRYNLGVWYSSKISHEADIAREFMFLISLKPSEWHFVTDKVDRASKKVKRIPVVEVSEQSHSSNVTLPIKSCKFCGNEKCCGLPESCTYVVEKSKLSNRVRFEAPNKPAWVKDYCLSTYHNKAIGTFVVGHQLMSSMWICELCKCNGLAGEHPYKSETGNIALYECHLIKISYTVVEGDDANVFLVTRPKNDVFVMHDPCITGFCNRISEV